MPRAIGAEKEPVLVVPDDQATMLVAVPLPEDMRPESAGSWQLFELIDETQPSEVPTANAQQSGLPAQLVPGIAEDGSATDGPARLLAAIPPREAAEGSRRFRLEKLTVEATDTEADTADQGFQFEDINDASIKLSDGSLPVMVYNHGVITNEQIPQYDTNRSRACYIHPVWGLDGEVLTDDFPRDHVHHHGIFWTWPHVIIDGVHHDLWLGSTMRDEFVDWVCRETGPVAAVLAVENGWFVGEQKVMIERVWIRAYQVADDTRVLDLEAVWIPVENAITLRGAEEKGYGGMNMRFAPRSERDAMITIPDGQQRDDLVMARLPWTDFTSLMLDGPATPSGATLMVHPKHPDFPPEWMVRHYGLISPGWPGVNNKTLEPGKPVRLDYRVRIHRSTLELAELEKAYATYKAATEARWE